MRNALRMCKPDMSDPLFTKRKGKRLADEVQASWAYRYKEIMDDEHFRGLLVKSQDKLGFYELDGRPVRFVCRRGTILDKLEFDDGTGHYMAYFLDADDNVVVYDPAAPGSTFGQADIDAMLARVEHKLGKPAMLYPYHHQFSSDVPMHDDTWCQSWSAAFLDNTMRAWLPDHNVLDFAGARSIMRRIVEEFVLRMGELHWSYKCQSVYREFLRHGFGGGDRFYWFYDDRVKRRLR